MIGHVTLDALHRADAPDITRAMREWEVVRWLPDVPWPYGTDDAADLIAADAGRDMAIRVRGQFAGLVRRGRDPSIWVAPRWQRRGIGKRAAIIACSRHFMDGAAQIRVRHLDGNHRAAALLSRLGFREAGTQDVPSRPHGHDHAARTMILTCAAFEARQGIALVTRRLVIDAVRPADLPALRAIATHPDVARMLLAFHHTMSEADFAALFPLQTLVPPLRLAVRRGGQVIGSIGVGPGASPAIFYFLHPDHEGQGLATEMVRAFVHEIVARFHPPMLIAQVCTDNPASRRVLEKVGFAVMGEGVLRSRARPEAAPGWLMGRMTPVSLRT